MEPDLHLFAVPELLERCAGDGPVNAPNDTTLRCVFMSIPI